MSTARVPDYILEQIAASLQESNRLRLLSNKDLVLEYLKLNQDQDDELHTNEMCSRLWPGWETADIQ